VPEGGPQAFSIIRLCFLLLVACFFAAPVHAQCWSGRAQSAKVQSYNEDGTFLLDDGRRLVLVGLERPLSPVAMAAWRSISSSILSQPVSLHVEEGRGEDRYGRLHAYVETASHYLLQTRLVAAGWARVYPTKEGQACIADLLKAEARARADQLGIWSDSAYQLRDAADTNALMALNGTYQIVVGKVLGSVRKKHKLYLNFGEDWKTDFTVTVVSTNARLFDSQMFGVGVSQEVGIVGKRVRVRGFLSRYNGPNMEITNPDQIEILGE